MTSRFSMILLVITFAGLFIAYNTFYIVPQTETALVTQFGNPVAVELTPGLKVKTPFTQTVEYFDKRLLEYVMPEEIEINASDEKRIRLEGFLRWRIVDPLAFARATRTAGIGGNRLSTMNLQLSNLLGSAMRQVIGSVPMNALLSPQRDQIMRQIRELVAKQAASDSSPMGEEENAKNKDSLPTRNGYGIEIVDVRIVKADLPPENSAAVFRRMQTEREREAKSYRAQGDEEAQRIRAEADRDRTVLLAQAQKKAEILRGEGDAQASRTFADAFGKDPKFFEFYRTMQAYMHTLSPKDTTVILSPNTAFLKQLNDSKE